MQVANVPCDPLSQLDSLKEQGSKVSLEVGIRIAVWKDRETYVHLLES